MSLAPEHDLGAYVRAAADRGVLVVQPRMGMAPAAEMAAGLRAVAAAPAVTVGTITVDSYTRVGDLSQAATALAGGSPLNGFPIVAHGPAVTAEVAGVCPDRPVQVRHGSPRPESVFRVLAQAGLSATEGGPVSYCLPYGRTPLAESTAAWQDASVALAEWCAGTGRRAHVESFGGCLLGQLCPPSLLIAVSVLEAMFFAQCGVPSVSLSYAQQTDPRQDVEALAALRRLADELLAPQQDRHLVLYTYMGVFPNTRAGARLLLERSAELAVRGGAERLIVKTEVEAQRLPSVAENITALTVAARAAERARRRSDLPWADEVDFSGVLAEAQALVYGVLDLSDDVGTALVRAFRRGLLDVPFCLHRDNAGQTRSTIDGRGRLVWERLGALPLPASAGWSQRPVTSAGLLRLLRHKATECDVQALDVATAPAALPAPVAPPATAPVLPAAVGTTATAAGSGPDSTVRPYRIAVLGVGPRGLSVLERLVARLSADPPDGPVEVYAIDSVHVGPGRIWRTSQPHWLLMNTPAGEVTMFSGAPDDGPTRPGAGPDLARWWGTFDPDRGDPLGYAPRNVFGQYLRYVLNRIERAVPEGVRLTRLYVRVEDLERADGGYLLHLDDGQRLAVDRLVLTTGHTVPRLRPEQRELAEFAAARPGLSYIPGDSVADMRLDGIPAGATVAVVGLGLSFYDLMMTFTLGRGGTFHRRPDGSLRYQPSRREPVIVAGSRSGVPLLARGRNQKDGEFRYHPRIFTRDRMLRARERGRLRFDTDVLPWLLEEVRLVYYGTAIRQRFGADVADRFATEAVAAADAGTGADAVTAVARLYGVGDLPPVDLAAWSRPFDGRTFADPAEFTAALVRLLHDDLALSDEGNVDGPVKACLDTIRDCRGVVRVAVDYDGLYPDSHTGEFLTRFAPVASHLTTGPPRERIDQLLALLDAGVVRLVGPGARYGTDPRSGRFVVESGQVAGSRVLADALVDARVPAPDLLREGGLLARLRDRGLLRGHVNTGPAGDRYVTGGVDVTPSPFHPRRADGRPEHGMNVLGIPTEFTRWFTQVGSSRPGPWGEFMADADAIAADVLRTRPAVPAVRTADAAGEAARDESRSRQPEVAQ